MEIVHAYWFQQLLSGGTVKTDATYIPEFLCSFFILSLFKNIPVISWSSSFSKSFLIMLLFMITQNHTITVD